MKLGGLYESHCYDCLQKEEEEEEILLLPMEGKVSEIPTADYPPVSAVSFFRKIYSDVFEAGGLVINGKNTLFNHSCLSIYLDVANANDLPSEWSRYSHFCLAVVNQSNTNYSITRGLFSCLIFYSTRTGKCFFFYLFLSISVGFARTHMVDLALPEY